MWKSLVLKDIKIRMTKANYIKKCDINRKLERYFR